MSFTDNQQLNTQTAGQADWDSGLNDSFNILDRGFHGQLTAATNIATGDLLWVASGNLAWPYNPTSLDLKYARAISYKSVSSGETDTFLFRGIVNSVDVWSGNIIPGEPVFISAVTPGFAVSSYSAAAFPVGHALSNTGLYFAPGEELHREEISDVASLGELVVGSSHDFTIDIGQRGIVREVVLSAESHDLWTLYFYSGSSRVSSERIYETLSGGVNSMYMADAALFPYKNTDTASPGLIFGRIDVMSGTSVESGHVNVTVTAERFR